MELRRLGEPLLRSNPSTLLSFLVPSISPAWRPLSSSQIRQNWVANAARQNRRLFSATARRRADDFTSKPPAKPNKPQDNISSIFDRTHSTQPQSPTSTTTPRRVDLKPRINAKLDKLFPSTGGRSSPSSASDVEAAFRASTNANRGGMRSGSIASSMLMPAEGESSTSMQRQVAASILEDTAGVARRNKRTVRSRPMVGRTIEVEPALGMDFGQALKRMEIMLSANRVRADLRQQKYHERAGAKRKRLKGERWRKYFREGFRATVGRVKRMRRQGW